MSSSRTVSTPLTTFVSALVGATVLDVPPGTGAFAPPLAPATQSLPLSPPPSSSSSSAPDTAAAVLVSPVRAFGDGVEIVALHNLAALDDAAKERIFAHTFPYTARAFATAHLTGGDLSTMSPENRQDHLDHTFGGSGVTFLLGSPAEISEKVSEKETNSTVAAAAAAAAAEPTTMRLHAHLNASFVAPSATLDDLGAVVYVHAVCCDPTFQGRGFARKIFTEAVRVLRPQARYLTLRTMNVAIVKLMASVCKGNVYPVDPFDAKQRPDLPRIAEALRAELEWGTALQSDTLLIPRGYPPFLIPVFKGVSRGSALENLVDGMIDRDKGDCLCCISDLL